MATIYSRFTEANHTGKKLFIVLIDPDKFDPDMTEFYGKLLIQASPDLIFVGGSLTTESTVNTIQRLKEICSVPVVLFPGNALQFTDKADALLFLSLISGRNPDFLIGQHVAIAPAVHKSGIEAIPTGYILVESDETTSVEYISNTRPVPRNKPQLAATTALAGELLGHKLIYLEAGSGARPPVPDEMIETVKKSISIPLIVGGGLRDNTSIISALNAGADAVVVGNVLESNPELMISFAGTVRNYKIQKNTIG
jgi:putative glycerol-1-phosphate prenyltransferase